ILSGIRGWLLFLVLLNALCMTMTSFVLHFRAYISAMQKFRTDSYLSVADKLIAIVLVGGLLIFGSTKLPSTLIVLFVFAQLFALTLTALAAYSIVSSRQSGYVPKWNWYYMRAMLLHSFPFALLILQMTIYGRIDGYLLDRLLPQGSDETG